MFVFESHHNLKLNPLFLEIYKEFKFYKEDSAPDEHAAPSNHIQKPIVLYIPFLDEIVSTK